MTHSLKSLIELLPQYKVKVEVDERLPGKEFSKFNRAIIQTIADLFVPEDKIQSLQSLWMDYATSYKNIRSIDFLFADKLSNTSVESVFNYLDSIRNLFRFFFSLEKLKSYAPMEDVIKWIVNNDIASIENDTIEINIFNPMILESLLICYLQLLDFDKLKERLDGDKTRIFLYSELLQGKAERLFKDIIVLFNRDFYRIRGVKYRTIDSTSQITDIKFVAKKENRLSSIEVISATRMFEKIVVGLEKGKEYRALLVGEVMGSEDEEEPSTLADLNRMIADYGCKVTIDNVTREDAAYSEIFSFNGLKSKAEEYDKIFVLDSPEIYYPIELEQKTDNSSVLYRSQCNIKEILGNDSETGERDFFNKNGFAAICYRVQNYLLGFTINNLRKTRKVNTNFLDCFKNRLYPYSEDKKADGFEKQAYVYISNKSDFVDELYDMYNFVRVERYNSKDCRIAKFPEPVLPNHNKIVSQKRELTITLYKLLKMLSSDVKFYNNVLGLKKRSFKEIFDISKNVIIDIYYSPIIEKKIHLKIYSHFPYGTPESVEIATERLVEEMFDFSCRKQQNKILLYCYKKAVANVFSGCVDNINDCLFHHFYMKKLLSIYKRNEKAEIGFKIDSYSVDWFDFTDKPYTVEVNDFQYSVKRVAYEMLDKLDSHYCDNRDIIEQYENVRINRENINMYIAGLTNACEMFNYIDSELYRRLKERL